MYYIEALDPGALSCKSVGEEHDRQRALEDPSVDYFEEAYYLRLPKAQIGSYVADQGFEVPLITEADIWQRAVDEGLAMIRSESVDDYSSYRGLFRSLQLPPLEQSPNNEDQPKIRDLLANLALRGLREGEITPEDFMKYYAGEYRTWPENLIYAVQLAQGFNVKLAIDLPQASLWHYIQGGNVSIFGDPHVEGRYHIGFLPMPPENRGYSSIGGFWIENDQHNQPLRFRKHDEDFIAQPFIEIYEAVSALPLFDTEQRPVMELQMASDGVIHFLQYFKTGHRRQYCEAFDLPDKGIRFNMVRGITPPEGQEMRLFVAPNQFERGMTGEAIYCSLTRPGHLETQLASKLAGFVLHTAYISFKDNHFTSTPLFMPPLAAGFSSVADESDYEAATFADRQLDQASIRACFDRENAYYFNIHVTSNGRQIVIDSDWKPRIIKYEQLRS